jgi:MFS family permease
MQAQPSSGKTLTSGQWMVLVAAFLGWLFDGFEIGLFPVVARPALLNLLATGSDVDVGPWMARITACFLLGAAVGGLVFGWLGDRMGRVRALALSILTYSLFTGFSFFAGAPWQLGVLRFIGALGMGGEWSLGVALVMECWPEKWRPALAGTIGAAANVGFLLTGVVAKVHPITQDSWRWMFLVGAVPALLVFFIILAVPESERWREAVKASQAYPLREVFAAGLRRRTLLGIVFASVALIGTWGSVQWVPLWADQLAESQAYARFSRLLTEAHPEAVEPVADEAARLQQAVSRGLCAAKAGTQVLPALGCPVGLLVAPLVRVRLEQIVVNAAVRKAAAAAKADAQMLQAFGAILGCLLAPLAGARLGRRPAYFLLCFASLLLCGFMFRAISRFDGAFLITGFLVGGATASFYGWFPLYLPELFPTRVRATGQGLSYNFGRVFAAGGALVQGQLVVYFGGSYPQAGAMVTLVYLVGMGVIWLAPETKGKPLPA